MRCISKMRTMNLWDSRSNTSLTLILIIWLNSHKITVYCSSEELQLIFIERTASSSNQSISRKKTKFTRMQLKLHNNLTTPKLLRIWSSFSFKEKKNNISLLLCTLAMSILNLISSLNMPGDSTCMSSPCHLWFNSSQKWKIEKIK